MKKWAIAGVLYVATIIGGFQVYDTWMVKDEIADYLELYACKYETQ